MQGRLPKQVEISNETRVKGNLKKKMYKNANRRVPLLHKGWRNFFWKFWRPVPRRSGVFLSFVNNVCEVAAGFWPTVLRQSECICRRTAGPLADTHKKNKEYEVLGQTRKTAAPVENSVLVPLQFTHHSQQPVSSKFGS